MTKKVYVAAAAVVEGIATVLSILSNAKSLLSQENNDLYEAVDEINNRTKQIVELQLRAIDEIRALRVYFRDTMRAEFIHALDVKLKAHTIRLEAAVASLRRARTPQEVQAIWKDLKTLWDEAVQTIFEICGYGPATYQVATSGYGFIRANHEIRRRIAPDKPQRRVVNESERSHLQKLLEEFDKWSDPQIEGSFTHSLAAIIAERDALAKQVNDHPKRIALPERLERRVRNYGRGRSCEWYEKYNVVLAIDGTLQSGFTDRFEESHAGQTEPYCEEGIGPRERLGPVSFSVFIPGKDRHDFKDLKNLAPPTAKSLAFGILERARELAFGGTARARSAVGLVASHSITAELNRKRARWLELIEQQASLEAIIKNVSAVSQDIAERIKAIPT